MIIYYHLLGEIKVPGELAHYTVLVGETVLYEIALGAQSGHQVSLHATAAAQLSVLVARQLQLEESGAEGLAEEHLVVVQPKGVFKQSVIFVGSIEI
jgi:hypothetical protein